MLISIVLPVYRNAGSLLPIANELRNQFAQHLKDENYELIFVEDGSDDESPNEIKQILKDDTAALGLFFPKNRGQVAAILAGVKKAQGDAVIIISADGQDPPSLIPDMVAVWKKSNKLVIANRITRDESRWRKASSKFFYRIVRWGIPDIPKGGFDFFLIDRSHIQQFLKMSETSSFIQGMVYCLGEKPILIDYHRLHRISGTSQWTFKKKLKYATKALLFIAKQKLRKADFPK